MNGGGKLPGFVQTLLEQIYDVPVRCDVDDFLITDGELASVLDRSSNKRAVKEKLLVAQDGEYVELSLYLDAKVLEHLQIQDPRVDLHHLNLGDFWLVVEGISHFVYLAWNAHHDKCVTLMELEMQAEVDKFIAAIYLLSQQGASPASRVLHHCLFEAARFDAQLEGDSLDRYRQASRYAGKYCRTLYQRFLRKSRKPGMLSELRRFYRLPQTAKIRHIDTAFCAAR